MNRKNVIRISIFILLIFITAFTSFYIYQKKENNKDITPVIKHEDIISEIETPSINYEEELNKLKQEYNNDDIVGTLSIENTSFNEIVMQYSDNNYYLEHTVYHNYDWRGQTFLDYRLDINNSKKLIIYGHNSNNYDLPFKIFENYYNSDYLKEHKYLYLQTDKELKIYEIFTVYVEVKDWSYYSKINFNNDEEYLKHITNFKNKSFYDTGVDITSEDEILIIQTCSYHNDYADYENKFLLVMGKRIEKFDK